MAMTVSVAPGKAFAARKPPGGHLRFVLRQPIICYRVLRGGPSPPLQRDLAHESHVPSLRGHGAPPSRVVRPHGALLLHHGDGQRG
jgi:hypothetical protein